MTTLFAKPRRIENGEGVKIYVAQFNDAVAAIRPNRDELEHAWQQIRMDQNMKSWPLPAEVCGHIQRFRARQAAAERRAEMSVPNPEDRPMTPQEEAEFRNVVARLRANPEQYFAADALLRMAEKFERDLA